MAPKPQDPPDQTHLRLVPESVGTYFRLPARDVNRAAELIGEGVGLGSGVILSATDLERAADLQEAAKAAKIQTILDPMAVELSMPGGWTRSGITDLPWAGSDIHEPGQFDDRTSRQFCRQIAEAAVEADVDIVLSPSHYLQTLPSPWLGVDERLALFLRDALDDFGGRHIALYYPVVVDLGTIGPGPVKIYLLRSSQISPRNG